MPQQVVATASMMCTNGTTPAQLAVLPARTVMVDNKPAATVMDFAPTTNVPTFGMCISPTNPQVAAATAAALGVLTPQPCIPVTTSAWLPGSPTVMIDNQMALNNPSKLLCTWLGNITVTLAGQTSTTIP